MITTTPVRQAVEGDHGGPIEPEEHGQRPRRKDLAALNDIEKLWPLFERLLKVGCERDPAESRDQHFAECCCRVLL
jgi:hypothetical protein